MNEPPVLIDACCTHSSLLNSGLLDGSSAKSYQMRRCHVYLIFFTSPLRSSNLIWNASVTNEGEAGQFSPLNDRRMNVRLNQIICTHTSTNPENLAKIDPVHSEVVCLQLQETAKSKEKEETGTKYIAHSVGLQITWDRRVLNCSSPFHRP